MWSLPTEHVEGREPRSRMIRMGICMGSLWPLFLRLFVGEPSTFPVPGMIGILLMCFIYVYLLLVAFSALPRHFWLLSILLVGFFGLLPEFPATYQTICHLPYHHIHHEYVV